MEVDETYSLWNEEISEMLLACQRQNEEDEQEIQSEFLADVLNVEDKKEITSEFFDVLNEEEEEEEEQEITVEFLADVLNNIMQDDCLEFFKTPASKVDVEKLLPEMQFLTKCCTWKQFEVQSTKHLHKVDAVIQDLALSSYAMQECFQTHLKNAKNLVSNKSVPEVVLGEDAVDIVSYIGGYTIHKARKKSFRMANEVTMERLRCLDKLKGCQKDGSLVCVKSRGGLVQPSCDNLFVIMEETFREMYLKGGLPTAVDLINEIEQKGAHSLFLAVVKDAKAVTDFMKMIIFNEVAKCYYTTRCHGKGRQLILKDREQKQVEKKEKALRKKL